MESNQQTRSDGPLAGMLNSEITIFRISLPRRIWALIILAGFFLLSGAVLFIAVTGTRISEPIGFYFLGTLGALVSLLLLYLFLRLIGKRKEIYILLALLVSAAAFGVEGGFDQEVYAPFTLRTIVLLVVAFSGLTLFLVNRHLPAPVLTILAPVYLLGILICIPFIISMLPYMTIAWLLIPFGGLGLLPYAPLFAASAFAVALIEVERQLKLRAPRYGSHPARLLGLMTFALLVGYTGWFAHEWNGILSAFENRTQTSLHRNDMHHHLPAWTRSAMKMMPNHVTRLYLNTRQEIFEMRAFRGFRDENQEFDMLVYLADLIWKRPNLTPADRGTLRGLFFDESHVDLQRLWSGRNLKTTNVKTKIQLFPGARIAYLETELSVYNGSSSTQEAIYTLRLPEGSAATALSLWIDGREEQGRFTLKSRARRAYRTIVGVERRDPALLQQLSDGKLRLRVFPVNRRSYRTVKFGLIIPLELLGDRLMFRPIAIQGPSLHTATQDIGIDLFAAGEDINLQGESLAIERQTVSDDEVPEYRYRGAYREDYRLTLAVPLKIQGLSYASGFQYRLENISYDTREVKPRRIYLVLNRELSPAGWLRIYKKIKVASSGKSKLYLVGRELFYSAHEDRIERFLNERELPTFNVLPIYLLPGNGPHLIVTAGANRSLNYRQLGGSPYFDRMEKYYAAGNPAVAVATLNGKIAPYLKDLQRRGRLELVAHSEKDLLAALRTKSVSLPLHSKMAVSLEQSGVTIHRLRGVGKAKSVVGGDLLQRLFFRQRLYRLQQNRDIRSLEKVEELRRMAHDVNLVSSLSSLIVLETEKDYQRFGIGKRKTGLGQTKVKNVVQSKAALGTVPEPEEYALMAVLLMVLLYLQRRRLLYYIRRIKGLSQWA